MNMWQRLSSLIYILLLILISSLNLNGQELCPRSGSTSPVVEIEMAEIVKRLDRHDPFKDNLPSLHIQSFHLQEFLDRYKNLIEENLLTVPEFYRGLDGEEVFIFSDQTTKQVLPFFLKLIEVETPQGKKNLQECLKGQLMTKEEILSLLSQVWHEWKNEEQQKIVKKLDTDLNSNKQLAAKFKELGGTIKPEITRLSALGATRLAELDYDEYVRSRFDQLVLKGIFEFSQLNSQGESGLKGKFAVNGKYLEGVLTHLTPNQTLGLSMSYMYGFPLIGFKGNWNLPESEWTQKKEGASIPVFIAAPFWTKWVSLYGSVGLNLGSGNSFLVGGSVILSKDREVNYLGPYSGENKELKGLHGLEVNDQNGMGGFLDLGFFTSPIFLGGGIRGGYYKTNINQYKTHLPLGILQKYLKDRKKWGLKRLFSRQRQLVEGLPQMDQPQAMRTDDEVTIAVERDAYGILALGLNVVPGFFDAIKIGGGGSFKVKYEIKVKKLADNKIQATLTNIRIDNWTLFLRLLQLIGCEVTDSLEMLHTETLLFDLNHPQAEKFYHELLLGKVPSFFSLVKKNSKKNYIKNNPSLNMQNLITSFDHQSPDLGLSGVTRTYLEKEYLPLKKMSLAAKINWLPPTFLKGLGVEKVTGRGTTMKTDGKFGLNKEIDISFRRKEKIIKETSKSVSSVVRRLYSQKAENLDSQFVDLKVSLIYQDSRSNHETLNKFIEKLNTKFGLNLVPFKENHENEDRKTLLERVFSREEIERIGNIADDEIFKMYKKTKVGVPTLLKLRDRMKSADFNQKITFLQAFFNRKEGEGVRALHLLLGGKPSQFKIITDSSFYKGVLQRAKDLVATYLDAESPNEQIPRVWPNQRTPKKIVQKFYSKVMLALKRLEMALNTLQEDPFFPSERGEQRGSFQLPPQLSKESVQRMFLAAKDSLNYLLDFKAQNLPEVDRVYLEESLGLNGPNRQK